MLALVGVAPALGRGARVEAQLVPATEVSRERPGTPMGPPLVPGVRLELREEYYDVEVPTLTDVVARLNQTRLQGPNAPPSQGLTRYNIRPEWSALARGGRCVVRNVELTVEVVITLPRWPGVFDRPVAEREGWAQIDHAIRAHEYMHQELVLAAAEELLSDLRGLDARGCSVLQRTVSGTVAVAGERLDRAHQALDEETPPRLSIGGR